MSTAFVCVENNSSVYEAQDANASYNSKMSHTCVAVRESLSYSPLFPLRHNSAPFITRERSSRNEIFAVCGKKRKIGLTLMGVVQRCIIAIALLFVTRNLDAKAQNTGAARPYPYNFDEFKGCSNMRSANFCPGNYYGNSLCERLCNQAPCQTAGVELGVCLVDLLRDLGCVFTVSTLYTQLSYTRRTLLFFTLV